MSKWTLWNKLHTTKLALLLLYLQASMYIIHPQGFLSISTLHTMPLGTDGLACNQAHTSWTPFWMAVQLNWLGKPWQFSNADLGTQEKLPRCLSDSYLLGCGDLGSFFLSQNKDSWTDQSECWLLKLKQLKLNAGLSHVVKRATERKEERNNFTAVQVQIWSCTGKRSLNLGVVRQD